MGTRRRSRARTPCSSARRTSARCSRTSSDTSTASLEVPPGVDVDAFRPVPRDEALAQLLEEARRDPPNPGNANERLPDEGNAERFAEFFARPEPTVVYFGKLIYNKGVHLLLEALNDLDAKAVIVGFGDYRAELEALGSERTLFTGALEHRHLAALLPLCDVAVVPSIFPEAFGMVAAEAAAAGVTPLVARHSGLAEVADGLEAEYPPERAPLTSFSNGDVAELRDKLAALLALPADERAALGEAARRAGGHALELGERGGAPLGASNVGAPWATPRS